MCGFFAIDTKQKGLNGAIADLLGDLLEKGGFDAMLVPCITPFKKDEHIVMQTLVVDREHLDRADPFAPVATANSAKVLSSLTYQESGKKLVAVVRSCEVRAFIELVKLNQGRLDDLLLIGIDCNGRYENNDYLRYASRVADPTAQFLDAIHGGNGSEQATDFDITEACKNCEYPVANNVDMRLCVFGADPRESIHLEVITGKGSEAVSSLGLAPSEEPPARQAAVDTLLQTRLEHRDRSLAEMADVIKKPEGILEIVGNCVNCYNCRVACPVCYCRECVFVTETFRHSSEKYFMWAEKKGRQKMPTDTVFYHLTRMLHMSTLCVGCGQCTSACPNDIPVGTLFRTVARATQGRFEYQPGHDVAEPQPLSTFHSDELLDVTGQEAAPTGR
jgi:formate dehydrogenase subunit beta